MYGCEDIQKLIERYAEKSGNVVTLEEGCLGYGTMMLYGKGLKTCIVKECYLNEWSSGHKIRFYNKTPQKYLKMMERLGF